MLFSASVHAFSLNLSKSIYAKEEIFQGTITLDQGNYLASEKVTLTTNSDSKQVQLQSLVNCNLVDCSSIVGTYTSTGATEPSLPLSSTLTGFKIKKNSVIESANFDISNEDSNLPDQPSIDIGNDNSPEWVYPGYSTSNYDPISFFQTSNFEETLITENCQLFSLPKSSKYKVQAYVKKQPSSAVLDIYMPQLQKDGSCQQPSTSWGLVECNIDLTSPVESGDYYICLTGSNNILATNSTSPDPKGYVSCSTGCTPVGKNYIMNFSAASFITTLDHVENFNTSNAKKDSFGIYKPLTDILNEYLSSCPIQNDYCIIPINVSSKNTNQLRVSNLNYQETTEAGEVLLQHGFLSSITQQGTSPQISINSPLNIQISQFNFEAPSVVNTYHLQASFLSQADSKNYSVVEGPRARLNVSKTEADILESIRFDASESSSSNNLSLSYFWKFGDNLTSEVISTTHSYSKAGTYVVELTVTDQNNISSTTLKTLTIGSSQLASTDLLTQIDEAEQYLNAASKKVKDVYKSLGIDAEIKSAKTTLVSSNAITEAQANSIKSKIPKSLIIQESYELNPFLTTQDLDLLLPLQEESFKDTARTVNEKITQKINVYLVAVTYLSGQSDNFIVVSRIIEVPQIIQSPLIIDLLPTSLVSSHGLIKFLNPPTGEVTNLDNYQSIRLSPPQLEISKTNEIAYKISSTNINQARLIKTLVLPEDLNIALVPINCGDGICNPAEDINICPEDCTCGNNICEIQETESSCPLDCGKTPVGIYMSILVLIGIIGGIVFLLHKSPELRDRFNLNKFFSVFSSRKDILSDEDLDRLIKFIKSSQ